MKVYPLPPKEVEAPPPWVLQHYLVLAERLDVKAANLVTSEEIAAASPTPNAGNQMAHLWVKHGLALRIQHGRYAIIDPSVAIRSWAIPRYYAELLILTDALTRAGIPHAFACLTAGRDADYVAERPFLVVRSQDAPLDRVDHFAYKYPAKSVAKVRLDVLGQRFHVPALSKEQTALVLASTSLPREVRAAKQLLTDIVVTAHLAKQLNALGLRLDKKVYESEDPHIKLPTFIEERRRKHADEALKEGLA